MAIKIFHDKNILVELVTSKPDLQRIMEEILQSEEKKIHTQESSGNNKHYKDS